MKNKKKYQLYVFFAAIGIYIITIIVALFTLQQVPHVYLREQDKEYAIIKEQIIQKIEQHQQSVEFSEIKNNYAVEFVIHNVTKQEMFYATLPFTYYEELEQMLNGKAISREESFDVIDGNEVYNVWLVQYYVSPQRVVDSWFKIIAALILLLYSILFWITFLVFYQAINPLQKLRENIMKLSKYQLNRIEEDTKATKDVISTELVRFSHDLLDKIEHAEDVYTGLEMELQMQNEEAKYREKLLASLSHDLKTPIYTAQLQIEKVLRSHMLDETGLDVTLEKARTKIEQSIIDINELIKIVYQENIEQLKKVETFDLVELLYEVEHTFSDQFEEKEYEVENEVDMHVAIKANRIRLKQVIYNAFSNIYDYAPRGATVICSCYEDNDYIYLSFYNDGTQLTEEQAENIFKLFYRISDGTKGTGVGLHTIAEIVKEIGGVTSFINKDAGVELNCVFDKQQMFGAKEL